MQHTEETKNKISESRKGKNLGNTHGFVKGNIPWNKGKNVRLNPNGEFKKGLIPWNLGKKIRVERVCKGCGKKEMVYPSRLSNEYCSRECLNKHKTSWNKGLKGFLEGEKSPHWKGNGVGYSGKHMWIKQIKGSANLYHCHFCGEIKKVMHWANISHEYKREVNDYMSLCPTCHYKYDSQYRKEKLCQ